MSEFPKIRTAIPQRRYQFGDFAVTVLGEIESGDGHEYRFLAAFVRDGEVQPRLFVAAERAPVDRRTVGSHALRLVNSAMDEVMDVSDRWARLDDFSDQALQMGAQLLGLDRETPYRLM